MEKYVFPPKGFIERMKIVSYQAHYSEMLGKCQDCIQREDPLSFQREKNKTDQIKDQKSEMLQMSQQLEDDGIVCISYLLCMTNLAT